MEDIPPEAVVSTQTQLNMEGPTIDNSHAVQRESGMIIFSVSMRYSCGVGMKMDDIKMPQLQVFFFFIHLVVA